MFSSPMLGARGSCRFDLHQMEGSNPGDAESSAAASRAIRVNVDATGNGPGGSRDGLNPPDAIDGPSLAAGRP